MNKWFSIQNKADAPTEILIYEQIGKDWFTNDGIAAKDFAEALAEIPKEKEILVRINSPGGSVWDGVAIFNMLKDRGNVTTRVDGVAASIASVIALAGKVVEMPANALMMIHRAWAMAAGNAKELTKLAADLEKHDDFIAGIYSEKNKKTREENLAAMDKETWFNGNDAKAFGLIDSVLAPVQMSAMTHDLSKFKNFSAAQFSGHKNDSAGVVPSINVPDNSAAQLSAPLVADAAGATAPTQQKANKMENTPVAAVAPAPAPANDSSLVIAAINSLGEQIKNIVTAPQGAAPLAPSGVQLGEAVVVKEFKNIKRGTNEFKDFVVSNYSRLSKELPGAGIYNANTVDSGLANSLLANDAVQTMRTYVAPLGAYTRSVAISPLSKRQVINVPLVSSSGSIQTNPTNFETGDTTLGDVAVTVNQYSKSWTVSNPEQNLGLALAQLAPTNAKIIAEGIVALVTAKMTNGNYGADNVIGTAANFDSADLPAILALGKNFDRVTLVLDGGHLAYLLPTDRNKFAFGEPGAYGFDGGIYKNNLWTGGATDICGFVCAPDAIAIATGMPSTLPTGEAMVQESVAIGAGLSVMATTWFSRASRSMWGSFDIMFGCAVGDATQGKVLTTQ